VLADRCGVRVRPSMLASKRVSEKDCLVDGEEEGQMHAGIAGSLIVGALGHGTKYLVMPTTGTAGGS